MVNYKYMKVNFWASFIGLMLIVVQLIAEYKDMKVLYDWAYVSMYMVFITGAAFTILGVSTGIGEKMRKFFGGILKRITD